MRSAASTYSVVCQLPHEKKAAGISQVGMCMDRRNVLNRSRLRTRSGRRRDVSA